ncbi:MAG: toll/interleukin-1 receptor domain-containing protein [archaeon]|nr:toll/interleukin-1 receptor domain-containing protein [archaeon]
MGNIVFISYSTEDTQLFQIPRFAEELAENKKIDQVLYWQEDANVDIVEYMEKGLETCDAVLLFCTPNSAASNAVKKEYSAAHVMGKPIVPVFTDIMSIPTLLKAERGLQFDLYDFQKNLDQIVDLIQEKIQGTDTLVMRGAYAPKSQSFLTKFVANKRNLYCCLSFIVLMAVGMVFLILSDVNMNNLPNTGELPPLYSTVMLGSIYIWFGVIILICYLDNRRKRKRRKMGYAAG